MMILMGIFLTVAAYYIAKVLYSRKPVIGLSPLLVCPALLIFLLAYGNVSYQAYYEGAQWFTNMLQPATVAFAVPLYKHRSLIQAYALEIVVGVVGGSVIALITSVAFSQWFQISPEMMGSMAPRSITTPLAMLVSQNIGGIPALTAVFVILTGLTGILLGPLVVRYFSIKSEVSKGLLMGMGAHACGTSKAYEMGQMEGAVASLTMIFAGIITLLLAPLLVPKLAGILHSIPTVFG